MAVTESPDRKKTTTYFAVFSCSQNSKNGIRSIEMPSCFLYHLQGLGKFYLMQIGREMSPCYIQDSFGNFCQNENSKK